ncbi:MAG: HAMP domain-containing histidine kinase [Actinomycetota bacterium]|nr:HAMP domain-containing histidine kinase [Actinomycetota bacterium]
MTLREQMSDRVSLALRITILTTLAVAATIAALCLAVYLTVRSQLVAEVDDALGQRAEAAAASGLTAQAVLQGFPAEALVAADIRIAVIWDGRAREVSMDAGLVEQLGSHELAVSTGASKQSLRTVQIDGEDYRMVAVPGGDDRALVLAQSLEPTQATLKWLGFVFWIIGFAGVLFAGMAGWAVATNSLRPVRRLTDAAERIAATEQLTPIEVSGDDELARLTVAFNSMLEALAASLQRQRQLVADAGHELRTPLTSLRTNIELLSQADTRGGLSERTRGELLADIGAQIGELSTLVGDLVELARDEPLIRSPEPVDLAQVVDDAVQRVQRRGQGVTIDVQSAPWLVVGDPQLLERAVLNLLDNAVKWSPPLGTVHVRLADGVLSVADEGPGISNEDLPHVFERFYRSHEARTLPGSGLGLAIVEQTAQRHGGQVRAGRAATGGALFTLRLPGAPAADRQPVA